MLQTDDDNHHINNPELWRLLWWMPLGGMCLGWWEEVCVGGGMGVRVEISAISNLLNAPNKIEILIYSRN